MGNHRVIYSSIEELAAAAIPHIISGRFNNGELGAEFFGVDSVGELRTLAVDGWQSVTVEAMAIAESVVDTVQQDHNLPSFRPLWDVTGCEVDVGRYLANVPENMMDYEPVSTPRAGRVITLCASVAVSAAVSVDSIRRRGYAVAALAFALSRMGLATEIWADSTTVQRKPYRDGARALVKGANDELDPARIMFGLAHPAMNRALMLPARHEWPGDARRRNGVGSTYGLAGDPVRDLPEGTIYLPPVRSSSDVPNADVLLRRYLAELGLIEE